MSNNGGGVLPRFVDVTAEAGIDAIFDFRSATLEAHLENVEAPRDELPQMIGGVACDDFDNDGWLDVFVLCGSNGHRLYRNTGYGDFEDVSARIESDVDAFASGPIFADFDGDGFSDLLLGGIGERRIQLLRNEAGQRFSDATDASGLTQAFETVGFGIGDVDGDRDLDILAARWGQMFYPAENDPALQRSELLFINDGSAVFSDSSSALRYPLRVTRTTPNGELSETALTPNFSDIDGDGDVDLLLAQDFDLSSVYLNQSSPTADIAFRDVTDRNVINEDNAMGSSIGDYDNDGDLDWFLTSISAETSTLFYAHTGNRLYRNEGGGVFSDQTDHAGVRFGSWGWAACFADFDNDGWLDIFHTNGWGFADPSIEAHSPEFLDDPARLFISREDERGRFVEAAKEAGIDDRGQGRGVVCFDYDRDGDVDVLLTNSGGGAKLYQNQLRDESLPNTNYLAVRLDRASAFHRAIGARVLVRTGTLTQTREIRVQNNYVSQDPLDAHFGLGAATEVDDVRVVWPDGGETVLTGVRANRSVVVREAEP